jgi:hypothetical protein
MFSMGWWRDWMLKPSSLKNGMFSNNTAKHFSQRANKYNYAILVYDEISISILSQF